MRRLALSITAAALMLLAGPVHATEEIGDPASGERIFGKCKGCHEIGAGAKDRVGPHLNDVFGRRAAAHDGFAYSVSMRRAGDDGLYWSVETLDAYIENPRSLVSKTRMSFRGIKDEAERTDLLAYLREASGSSETAAATTEMQHESLVLDPNILALEGDPEYGAYLSSECLTCHQTDGSADGIPSITQWHEEDFVVAMHAYKRKLRPHPVMQMMAGRLNDEEIAALAAYFRGLE